MFFWFKLETVDFDPISRLEISTGIGIKDQNLTFFRNFIGGSKRYLYALVDLRWSKGSQAPIQV